MELHCSETVGDAADRAIEIRGGLGSMRDSPVESAIDGMCAWSASAR